MSISQENDKEKAHNYSLQSGISSSSLEDRIFEELYGSPAVSTIKVLTVCHQRGIPVYTVDSKNANEVLPKLKVSNFVKSEVVNAVNSGKVVTIPEEKINYYDWHGVGYIVQDTDTGSESRFFRIKILWN